MNASREAKLPVLLLGMRASAESETEAIRHLIAKTGLPVVETFQGAGIISRALKTISLAVWACSVISQETCC